MPVQPFPFIVDGIHGDVPMNFYPAADSERGVICQPTMGLNGICTLPGCTEIRGLYSGEFWGAYPRAAYNYAVARGPANNSLVFTVGIDGSYAQVGEFFSSYTGPVWITNNGTQLLIVDGVLGYVYTPALNTFTQITDPNFVSALTCDYQDGYGLFTRPGSGQWFFSSLFDFTTFDSLDFYTKETRPDNLTAIKSFMKEVWLLGEKSAEIWYNAGGDNSSAQNPTFAPNAGGLIEYGLGAPASLQVYDGESLVWLSDNTQLVRAAGYIARVISNQLFDREVKTYRQFKDAISFSFRQDGHTFYQLTFPTAGVTWVLDATTKLFHKRSSYSGYGWGRHRANCYAYLQGRHWVGDYENGTIYEMSPDFYDDDGHNIRRVLYAKELDNGLDRVYFPSVQVITEAGVGLEDGSDPQVMLDFTEDGGKTWSREAWRSAGTVGKGRRVVQWAQQGSGFKRMNRLTFTDPVLWRVLGFSMGPTQ